MKKERLIIIYADTLEELQVNTMGYHHDHCWHYYFGKTIDIPKNLKEFVVEVKKYVFLCEED
jgi:hypothetical protein